MAPKVKPKVKKDKRVAQAAVEKRESDARAAKEQKKAEDRAKREQIARDLAASRAAAPTTLSSSPAPATELLAPVKSACDHQLEAFDSAAPFDKDASAASHGSMTLVTNATSAPALTAVTPASLPPLTTAESTKVETVPAITERAKYAMRMIESARLAQSYEFAKKLAQYQSRGASAAETEILRDIHANLVASLKSHPLLIEDRPRPVASSIETAIVSPISTPVVRSLPKTNEFKFNSHKTVKIITIVLGTTIVAGLLIGGACFLITPAVIAAMAIKGGVAVASAVVAHPFISGGAVAAATAATACVSALAVVGYKAVSNARREMTRPAATEVEAKAAPVPTA